ncbi:MAG: hypothetical protein ACQCN6_13345 [Candidatus Bathyarchaeia archaeon]
MQSGLGMWALEDLVTTYGTAYLPQNSRDNGSRGNYWSDYTGVDGDSVGNSPYAVNAQNADNPLMHPAIGG